MFVKIELDYGGVNFPLPYKEQGGFYVGFISVFSGCRRAIEGNPCPGCQNPSLWNFTDLPMGDTDFLKKYVSGRVERLRHVASDTQFFYCVIGGEPLDQAVGDLYSVHDVVMEGIGEDVPTILYSGYENLADVDKNVLSYVRNKIMYLKLGAFLGLPYRKQGLKSGLATENQRWIRVAEELEMELAR